MAHKNVSNKATFKNEGFLSKLSSSLMTRISPAPDKVDTRTSLSWHKTSEVKERIKTATGTIAVYADMSEDEVQKIKESVAMIPSLEEAREMEEMEREETEVVAEKEIATTVIAEAASFAVQSIAETSTTTTTVTIYIAIDDYTPDSDDGILLVSGQKVEVIDKGGGIDRRLEVVSEEGLQLLDNSAAKHKINIRPKRNHPSSKARVAQTPQTKTEERWRVRDPDTGEEGMVPANLLGAAPPMAGNVFATSIKRSLQEMSTEESMEVKKKLTKEMKEIKTSKMKKSSGRLLGPTPEEEAIAKRTATIRELIETEEEFVKDLEFVMENYYSLFDNASTPKSIQDQKESIFGNFKFIADFHKNVLIEGVKYHAEVPNLIGKTFLRLERDFDKHSEYCCTEPQADQFIENNEEIKEFFDEFSEKINDDKRIQEHIKLPIQRLNDYQLLLKEIVKFSHRLGDDTNDLDRAYDLMQTIPQRATDAKFLASIEGFKGNLFKLGRLIRHDWFSVSEVGHKTRERYLFLFKSRILITKVKQIGEDRSIFALKDIIRLPETSLSGLDRPKTLEFHHIEPLNHPNFPIILEARNQEVRDLWLEGVKEHVIDTASVDDLLFDDELRVVSDEEEGEEDRGQISPEAEVDDLIDDFPEHEVVDQQVPESLVAKGPTSKSIGRIIPIELEDESGEVESTSKRAFEREDQDFWTGGESSPPPKKRVLSSISVVDSIPVVEEPLTPISKEPLTPIQEELALIEVVEVVDSELDVCSKRPKEEDEVEDFWGKRESSPPFKRRALEQVDEESHSVDTGQDIKLEQVEKSAKADKKFAEQEKGEQFQKEDQFKKLQEEERLKKEAEEKLKKEKEEKEKREKQEKEEKERKEKEEKVKKEKEEKLKEEQEEKERKEKELKEKEEKERKYKEEKVKKEKEEKLRKEQEEKERKEKQLKEKEEKERKEKEQKERREKEEKEKREKELILRKEKEEKLRKEKEEQEKLKKEKEEKERKEKEKQEKEEKERKEKERKEKEEKERKEEEERLRKEKEEKQRKEKEEKIRKEKEEKQRKEKVEKERKEEEERVIKEEERLEKEKEEKARKEKEVKKSKEEKERQRKESEERLRKEKEKKERTEKEHKLKKEREEREREEKEEQERLKEEKEEKERKEKEEKLKKEQEEKEREQREEQENKQKEELKRKDQEKKQKEEKLKKEEEKKEREEIEAKKKAEEEREKKEKEEKERKKKEKEAKKSKEENQKQAKMEQSQAPPTRPVFTKSLSGEVVEPGEGANFVCEVEHTDPYYVTWLKDNKILNDKLADRVQQKDDGNRHTLRLLNCKIEDTGIYTAKATDPQGSSATCSAQLLVQELTAEEKEARIMEKKPFFVVKMKDTGVIENTKLSYAVHTKGDPMPNVKFFKDGKPLKEDDRVTIRRDADHGKYELVIGHVQMADAGVYRCIAMNKFEQAECEATMTVTEETQALQTLKGKGSLLEQGEHANFKWFRDGVEFDPLERFNVMFKDEEDTLALVFQNVTPDDAGIYTCVASTSCGKISCSAELTVEGSINRLLKDPEPPVFQEALSDTYVAMAGTAMLECRVSGYPKPDLIWTRNGLDVKIGGRIKQIWEDDENVTLILKNITEADKGYYNVVARNDLGEDDTSCNLIIRSGPKFGKFEKQVGCDVGKPLVFSVQVQGEPLPELKWMKNGKEIEPSEHVKFESKADGTFAMKVDRMDKDDCGAYSIIATNDMGQRAEQFEIIMDSPPEITRGLDPETEKKANNDQTFEVRANGQPSPDATWYKNGKEISNDDKFKMSKDGNFYMLKIRNLSRDDRGTYKIVLENKNGKADSEGKLIVRGPPEFTTPLKDACAKEGAKETKLFVEFDSNPRPTVKWFFKDKAIHEETPGFTIKSTDITSILVIHNATPEFVGSYSVKASNEYGDRSSSAKFRLYEAPAVVEGLKDVEFLEDSRNVFQCKVTGVPVPEIKWTKNGQKYSSDEVRVITKKDGDEIYQLLFSEAKTDDSAQYCATLSNAEGTVTTEGSIIVNTPPHIIVSNFRDGKTLVAMHKFVLELEASAVPEAVATWTFNGRELQEEQDSVKFSFDGKKYRMERIGSDPDHTGEYRCTLKNKIKEAEEAGNITVIEKESRVRQPLKNVNVKEKTDGTIQCQIVGDPVPTVQWLRNGKPLSTNDDRIVVKEDREKRLHYLTFKNIAESDKSTFTLKATNEHGDCETSCVMAVFVAPRPGELQDTVVDFGDDLQLNVNIHAIPPPKMTWFKDGKELSENNRVTYIRDEENEVYSLKITSVVCEDDATYTYKASNEVGEASGKSVVKIHTEKPSIVTNLKDVETCLEDEVTFVIKCSGLPPPVVEWKNKTTVVNTVERYSMTSEETDVHTITLTNITMEDYGKITCTARNLVGEASSSASFSQKKLACEVIEGLENVTNGGEGEDVTLEATIKGSPRPDFVWTKDGDVVEASANIKLGFKKKNYCEATISLTIIEANAMDSGQYRLRFFNEVNEATTETALVVRPVRRKPKISDKPSDLNVDEMEPGMFKCKIKGFPKPDVQWLKDGRVVRPTDICNYGMTADGHYFLEFKNVTLEDAGKYTIVAANDEGKEECDFNLNVNPSPSKPKFLQGLKATKVIGGYPCRMEVQLDGFPKPKVAWLKNGKPVEMDGTNVQEIQMDDGRVALQIAKATDADAGEYSAVASNDLGDNASSAALSVLDHDRKDGQPDGPPSFSEGLRDGSYDEGKTIRLPVTLRGGPVPDMKWFKDGKEIKLGDREFFTHDGDKAYLEIHPCVGSDTGKYKCVIENPNGQKETECEVTVRKCFEAPNFSYTFPNLQRLPEKDAKFTIKVDGMPKPEIAWIFNNKPIIPDGEKYRVRKDAEGCTLIVKDLTYSDSGSYKVIAKNKEGVAEHQATLTVADDADENLKSEAPNILKAIGDQELYEGYTAKFKAVVSGRPQPEYEWYRNGAKIFPNNRIGIEMDEDGIYRLTIKHVCKEDTGIYELKVFNEHGKAKCKGKLITECISKVKKRPVGEEYKGFDKLRQSGVPIPLSDKPIISALSDRRCTLSWYPHLSSGSAPPATYQVEYCECPEGEWITTRTGIRGCSMDITNLAPKSDYKFRVRVENKYGVSEPSPYVNSYRNRLEREPISHEPFLDPDREIDPYGPYVPAGFRINRDDFGNFYAAPRFMKLDYDTQYGMKNFSGRVKWIVYGYPTPKLRFYFKDEEITTFGRNSRYTFSHEANGEVYLFIENMTETDVGWYRLDAYNEFGESMQRIRLGLSEYPRVIQHLQETYIRGQGSGRIFCRIRAYPPCDVTWFKDWREIKPTIKMRPQFIEPDMYCLNFVGVSGMDSGLYSVSAVNVAGAVSSTCMVHVEEEELTYNWYGYGRGRHININSRRGILEDHYEIGDELGRGTQGVIYHCAEKISGRNFAAKSMWGKDEFKTWMHMEYDMMNLVNSCKRVVRLFDAYEGPKNMVLVMELCSGGELLHTLTKKQYITEYEISHYIKQVLEGLDYMHDRWIAHLGLDLGDIMITRPNGTDIRIGDLSLARNIRVNKMQPLEYGMPEYVAPEVVKGENVTYAADMWAVGIITYILLSGTSPFRGEHDRETLTRIQKGELRFDSDAFSNLSEEAKDFIAKLLQYEPETRMTVKSALNHPWIKFSELTPHDPYKINTDRLRNYYSKYREWYANASCRRWYRRRTLASAFTHPSKMVYPPGEIYTPPESPEREIIPAKPEDYEIPHHDLSYEIGLIKSDSRYQQGPDTYLLQLRDTDFPVRLRKYMNLARERSPMAMFTGRDTSYDYERVPVVHERRRFTDIMDEEIEDERRRTSLDKYTAGFVRTKQSVCSLDLPRRVKKEITSRYTIREEANAIREENKEKGTIPFLREKPNTTAITPHMKVVLTCVVTGDPVPVVQWFRNDIILGDTARIVISTVGNKSQLTINETKDFDVGFFKVVARNNHGEATHRFRLVRGEIPGMCDPPELEEISGTQILLRWRTPIDDGAAPIEQYHLQMKPAGEGEFTTLKDCIPQELYLVEGLNPNTAYQFRVAAKNVRGWGEFSVTTPAMRTGLADATQLKKPIEQHLLETQKIAVTQLPGARGEIRDLLDYGRELQPVPLKTGEGGELQIKKYKMVNEISRGRFSSVLRCIRQDDQRTFSCKVLLRRERDLHVTREYETAKSLRHERLATLYEVYQLPDYTAFITEYLGGQNVLVYLSSKLQYTEQNVCAVINQVLDGISYLHWRGLCHLDIQPSNIVLTAPNKLDVKIVDFGTTQKVDRSGSEVEVDGLLDYIAPEVLFDRKAYPTSDVWSVGVLSYVLLTGLSPFVGEEEEETLANIQCVRFKFETLGDLLSQEAIRFLMLIFKRDPSKRPTEEECRDHSWLGENDFMVRKRERHLLSTQRLREYSSKYEKYVRNQASTSDVLNSFASDH